MKMKKYSRAYVEITNICNRSCSFCPGTRRDRRRMTFAEFDLITDKLRPYTDYIYLHLMGEPLTHPELPELIRLAAGKGYRVAITTNGTLLERWGDELIRAGLYKLNISLHSFEQGTREDQLRYLNTCMDYADRASARGVLTVLRLWNLGYDESKNIDTLSALRERFPDGEWCTGSRGARIRPKLHLEYGEHFEWPSLSAPDLGEQVFCYGLGDHFGVLSDGTVVPCCLDRDGDIALGNLLTDDPAQILGSERAERMREGFAKRQAKEELCRRCGYARRFKI